MPNPLIKCAKRNMHSDALHRLGAIKVAATSRSDTPTVSEWWNQQVSFFNTIPGFYAFYHEKCWTSLLCLLGCIGHCSSLVYLQV